MSVAVRLEIRDLAADPERHERALHDLTSKVGKGAHADRAMVDVVSHLAGPTTPGCGSAGRGRRDVPKERRLRCRLGDSRGHSTASWLHACTRSAARRVFDKSMAMVIGPTPPGTGVIFDATLRTPSKSTSPTSE